MKRVFVVTGLFAMAALCCLFIWRITGRVVIEEESPSLRAAIRVRELQPKPFTIGGLLGLGENIYRCEYYVSGRFPMQSCQSYSGESFFPDRIKIEWKDELTAKVVFDEFVKFECDKGEWRRLDH